jgi:hypothetical protein
MGTVAWSDLRYSLAFQRAGSLAGGVPDDAEQLAAGTAGGVASLLALVERNWRQVPVKVAGERQRPEGVVCTSTTADEHLPRGIAAGDPPADEGSPWWRMLAGEEAACSACACPPDA